MAYFQAVDLATNRAIISILHHLDKVEGDRLCLTKGDVSNVWSSSKSSRRNIIIAAEKLVDVDMISTVAEGSITNQTVLKVKSKFVTKVTTSPKTIEFTFEKNMVKHLVNAKGTLFSYHDIEDLVGVKSRFTLNALLISVSALFSSQVSASYKVMRHIYDAENDYEHKQSFFRHVVKPSFDDLAKLPKTQFTYTVYETINPKTNRNMSYGININAVINKL